LHELEPEGSHVRFRPFSAGSGLPNLCERCTYADCHRDGDCNDHFNAYTNTNSNTRIPIYTGSATSAYASTAPDTIRQVRSIRLNPCRIV
jgi:hypothetical protein